MSKIRLLFFFLGNYINSSFMRQLECIFDLYTMACDEQVKDKSVSGSLAFDREISVLSFQDNAGWYLVTHSRGTEDLLALRGLEPGTVIRDAHDRRRVLFLRSKALHIHGHSAAYLIGEGR